MPWVDYITATLAAFGTISALWWRGERTTGNKKGNSSGGDRPADDRRRTADGGLRTDCGLRITSPSGELLGAFPATVAEVNAEYDRLYQRQPMALAGKKPQERLALCYYDVTGVPQRESLKFERLSVIIDSDRNSFYFHGGSSDDVPVVPLPKQSL